MTTRRTAGIALLGLLSWATQAVGTEGWVDASTHMQSSFGEALVDLAQGGSGPLDAATLKRFKSLIDRHGWPTVADAGRDGVDAAGDLLARSGADYDFQNDGLSQFSRRVDTDIDARAFLVLNDRIEVAQGHPQQAGMLFALKQGKIVLDPPLPSTGQADNFRASYGLPRITDEQRRLQRAIDNGLAWRQVMETPRLSTPTHKVRLPALQAELAKMAREDQAVRDAAIQSGSVGAEAATRTMVASDLAHLTRLRAIFKQHGFPAKADVGRGGVNDAWLLVQHAASDKDFMARALALAKPMAARGELSRGNYALLVDRVRLQQGRKQLYGSQLTGPVGHFTVQPLIDPAHVDERRTRMGLEPLADYIRETEVVYTPKSGPVAQPASSASTNLH